jgi:hypothetical protein
MQNPSFPLLQFRSKDLSSASPRQGLQAGFFDLHPVADIVRSVFVSSLLWAFLAFAVYTVYTMIAGSH